MKEFHDALVVGHRGVLVTTKKLSKKYYWSNLKGDVEKNVSICAKCEMNKASTEKKMGLLSPIPIPKAPYRCLLMDFMISLPVVQGYNTIFVVVDRFNKQARFISTK